MSGDLNNIMNANEKLGPRPVDVRRIYYFCCMVKQCGLFDLGYNGLPYTWTNKRFNSNLTYEHLDRCLGKCRMVHNVPNPLLSTVSP